MPIIRNQQATIIHDAAGFDVEIIRSGRRRTAAIRVTGDRVTVRVPLRTPREWVEDWIRCKRPWILKQLARHAQMPVRPERRFISGEIFPVLGRDYPLAVHAGTKGSAILGDGHWRITVPKNVRHREDYIRRQLCGAYRRHAERFFADKVRSLSRDIGVRPRSTSVRSYRARWGSCSRHGDLSFNWKLLMAPAVICEHVVIHELCHLREHNHGPAFWRWVGRHDPDYRQHTAWLRQHGQTLEF